MSPGGWDYNDEPNAEILDLRPGVGLTPRPAPTGRPGSMEPIDEPDAGLLPDEQLATDYKDDGAEDGQTPFPAANRGSPRRRVQTRARTTISIAASVAVGASAAATIGPPAPPVRPSGRAAVSTRPITAATGLNEVAIMTALAKLHARRELTRRPAADHRATRPVRAPSPPLIATAVATHANSPRALAPAITSGTPAAYYTSPTTASSSSSTSPDATSASAASGPSPVAGPTGANAPFEPGQQVK